MVGDASACELGQRRTLGRSLEIIAVFVFTLFQPEWVSSTRTALKCNGKDCCELMFFQKTFCF